ncbi:MAG: hypothetical protein ACOYIK_06475 [Coriobacteriales bacterium]|jgi:hypothetical protein
MSLETDYIAIGTRTIHGGDEQEIDSISREIIGTFSSEIPHLSSFRGSRIAGSGPERFTKNDLEKLVGKLKILRDKKDRELYGPYGLETISRHISYLEDALADGVSGDDLSRVYELVDNIYFHEYVFYGTGLSCEAYSTAIPSDDQTTLRIEKLKYIRDKEMRQIIASSAKGPVNQVAVENNPSIVANSSANATFEMTLENIEELPDSSLSEKEKTELLGLISELATMDREKREGRLKKVLHWLGDKGSDVFVAAMPYIFKTIQSQMN